MGTIKELKIDETIIETIREIMKEDKRYRVRKRANAILYKSQEYSVKEIAKILEVRADTVYEWICKYEIEGIESFYDKEERVFYKTQMLIKSGNWLSIVLLYQ